MNIDRMIQTLVDDVDDVDNVQAIGGGCISDAFRARVRLTDGRMVTWFVKTNDANFAPNFASEEYGLRLLRDAGVVRVPSSIARGVAMGRSTLILEWIDRGSSRGDDFAEFGRQLASLHRQTLGDAIGLDSDNHLGASPQVNSSCRSWPEFVAENRIGFQLRRAVDGRLASDRLRRDVENVIASIDGLLVGRQNRTSLLHGDLWSGNYWFDQTGRPVLIDPAVYYGCREAEFGMIRLFGGCPAEFFDAYQDSLPMPDGWQRRTSVYVLYHLMNHLNLFGTGYLSRYQTVAAEILS